MKTLDIWPEDEIFQELREVLREYQAVQTTLAKTLSTVEKMYKTPKTRQVRYEKAIGLLAEKHNKVAIAINKVRDYVGKIS